MMPTCKICLQQFKRLRFNTSRISVCGRCVNSLNEYKEVAEDAYQLLGDLLRKGMLRRADKEGSFESKYEAALPSWINRLVSSKANRQKPYKIIRAHRRGLLHLDRPHEWGYPSNWDKVARTIRVLDHFTCINCGARDVELHVHHIIYVTNFGTHQKQNLVTLCVACHEKEHKKSFDFGENMANTNEPPVQS